MFQILLMQLLVLFLLEDQTQSFLQLVVVSPVVIEFSFKLHNLAHAFVELDRELVI